MLDNPASTDGAKVGDGTFAIMISGLTFGEDDRHDHESSDHRHRRSYQNMFDILPERSAGLWWLSQDAVSSLDGLLLGLGLLDKQSHKIAEISFGES